MWTNLGFSHSDSVEHVEKLASPRFIKTHLPFNLLPEQLQAFATKAKVCLIKIFQLNQIEIILFFFKSKKYPHFSDNSCG